MEEAGWAQRVREYVTLESLQQLVDIRVTRQDDTRLPAATEVPHNGSHVCHVE
jgi:hypothetical protein